MNEEATGKVTDKHEDDQKVWIYPGPFYFTQYLDDARYLLGEVTQSLERCQNQKQYNFKFLQSICSLALVEFGNPRMCNTQVLQNIFVGESPVCYGNKYDLGYD